MELFERDDALHRLAGWLDRAAAGEGCLVLLGGEAGVGKTALVRRFCQEIAPRARVLVGACDALSTPRPLGPLLDIAGEIGGEIERLLAAEARREHVFGACLREFSGAWRPAVVVFEDVHWADEATLDLLRFLGRRIGSCRALLIATYRDDEVGSAHPLRAVLGDLATSANARRLPLPPLSIDGVRELARGSDLDAVELHRQTSGNPFFVTEVLAAGGGIPETVRDAVLTRVSRLSPTSQDALDVVAVAGSPVEVDLLTRLLGEQIEAIDECLAAGVLTAAGPDVAFRHELAREAIVGAISPPRRVALHARTMAVLEAEPAERRDLARLAHHAEGAGDRRAVLAYAPAAAERAGAMGAHREAAAQYERALRHATDRPAEERAALLAGWFHAAYATGRVRECAKVAEELAELACARGDLLDEANWLKWGSQALVNDGRNPEADLAMDRAIQLLERLPPSPVHARVFQSHAALRMLNRDYDQSLHWGERAVALARRFDLPDVHAGALNAMGSARLIGIDEAQGRAELEDGLAIARRAGIDRAVASILGNLGSGHGEIYRFAHAERYLTEGITFTRDRDLDGWHWYQVAWLALTRMFQGRWTEAADLAAIVLRTPAADAIALIMAWIALGRVRARRGDPEAWNALDAALALAEPTGTLQRIAPVRAARAEAAWLAGNCERATAEARAAFDLAVHHRHAWHIGELGFWLWRCGEVGAAPTGAAEPFARQMEGDWAGAAAAWDALVCPYEAARARARADNEGELRAALAVFERLGARPMAQMVARRLREIGVRAIPRGPRPATRANPANLTAREMEILCLIGEGLRNPEIAARLFLSPKTVEHHVSAIFAKLDVTSRVDATREAIRLGVVAQSGGAVPPT